jgi:hypothetical protein
MVRPIIISRKIFNELEFAGLFPLSGYDMMDDVLMPYLATEDAGESSDGLQLVVVVVIQHGPRYLVVEDGGTYSMGFVRECFLSGDGPPNSLCNIAVPAAQTLIEYYAPGTKYTMDALGLMQCERQGAGREWIGCLFLAETNREIESRTIGAKNISMMSIEEINERLGSDWGLDIATLARTCSGLS